MVVRIRQLSRNPAVSSSASETPQDSGSASPSVSGEASNTPDPSFSKGYSGGEKAPEGEVCDGGLSGVLHRMFECPPALMRAIK